VEQYDALKGVPSVRLLHTSDLHLDSLDSCDLLRDVIDTANAHAVNLMVIAGDFFDNTRVGQDTLEKSLEYLNNLEMPLVILPGNHDQLDDNSIYHRFNLSAVTSDVRLITKLNGERIVFPELGLGVWGRAMEEHTLDFHPLEGVPSRDDLPFQVALGHGFHFHPGEMVDRASPILSSEIESTNYDYIGLGHVHVTRDVSAGNVRAFYSGAPDPVKFPKPGPGDAALVTLEFGIQAAIEVVPILGLTQEDK
jgi:exonuclease SbcD